LDFFDLNQIFFIFFEQASNTRGRHSTNAIWCCNKWQWLCRI